MLDWRRPTRTSTESMAQPMRSRSRRFSANSGVKFSVYPLKTSANRARRDLQPICRSCPRLPTEHRRRLALSVLSGLRSAVFNSANQEGDVMDPKAQVVQLKNSTGERRPYAVHARGTDLMTLRIHCYARASVKTRCTRIPKRIMFFVVLEEQRSLTPNEMARLC